MKRKTKQEQSCSGYYSLTVNSSTSVLKNNLFINCSHHTFYIRTSPNGSVNALAYLVFVLIRSEQQTDHANTNTGSAVVHGKVPTRNCIYIWP